MFVLRHPFLLVAVLAATACTKDQAPPTAPVTPPAPPAVVAKAPHAAGSESQGLVGTILERLDAPPNYTYLRLQSPAGETWAAVPTTSLEVGARVFISNPMPMQNFESKTLGRTFDLVMFGSAARTMGVDGLAPAKEASDPHAGLPAAAPGGFVDLSNIKVARAEGPDGRTVAEVHGQRGELKDKAATVRGKVVKVTTGVLGHTWVHVRDGTGEEGVDNDLIITTTSTVALNQVISAHGTVRVDKDLGSGYAYQVLMEDATVTSP